MLRLLRIEFLKIKAYKTFWAFLVIYALLILLISSTNGMDAEAIFGFPMVWLNLARMASFLDILLGVLIILLICNEFSFKTFRQNVVDGLSREQAVTAKFALIKGIAFACVLFLFTYGMIRGLIVGHFDRLGDIFGAIHFLLRLFLQIAGYMGIAAFFAFLIRKTALTIVVYIVFMVVEYLFQFRIPDEIERYLPIHVFNALLPPVIPLQPTVPPLSVTVLALLTILYFLLCLTFSRLLMQRSGL